MSEAEDADWGEDLGSCVTPDSHHPLLEPSEFCSCTNEEKKRKKKDLSDKH